jgi:uncharacterized protein YbjT (DUF2867 family)
MTSAPQKSAPPDKRVALVAGSNGFVGRALLRVLLDAPDVGRVYALSRRPLSVDHPRLANRILPLESVETALKGLVVHDAYCCIGSTRAQAGSEAQRRRVDVDLVLTFARAALACGAQRLIVLSSAGASPDSRHAYLADKAQMEAGLRQLQFPALDILRPGLLLGWRGEIRPLELLGGLLCPLVNPLLRGRLATWRGIRADQVARAMHAASRSRRRGVYVYSGESLCALANQ